MGLVGISSSSYIDLVPHKKSKVKEAMTGSKQKRRE
jgi:hypothetical protein